MWEGGGVVDHGHESLLLQAAAAAHGAGGDASSLAPWFGPSSAAPPPYMPAPFAAAAELQPAAEEDPFGVVGNHYQQHQYGGGGMLGMEMQMGGGGGLLGRMTAKEIMDAKALAASRSHSEAERRRRQRINAHLARLRSLLPNTTKTDKASLLAEVIEHVKELKRQTSASSSPAQMQLMPTEADELLVEATASAEDDQEEGRPSVVVARASLCCEDRAELIPDMARALAALRLRARRAHFATLGGRLRSVLLIAALDDEDEEDDGAVAASRRRHELVASIHEALRGVMDGKVPAASSDTSSSGGGGSIKRQRMVSAHEQGSF
uniref:BHLH domain-containing protein n=1 Tax=Leersia perrieri TaxID=77586 RepID=A0A0D9X852_9ORYZ